MIYYQLLFKTIFLIDIRQSMYGLFLAIRLGVRRP